MGCPPPYFDSIKGEESIAENVLLIANSGVKREKNMNMLAREGGDGYMANQFYPKRDLRFDYAGLYRERFLRNVKERRITNCFRQKRYGMQVSTAVAVPL